MIKALIFTSVTFVLTFVVSMIVAVIIHLIAKIVQGKKAPEKIVVEKTAASVVEKGKAVLNR